jgi:hypothetical protein
LTRILKRLEKLVKSEGVAYDSDDDYRDDGDPDDLSYFSRYAEEEEEEEERETRILDEMEEYAKEADIITPF